MTIAKNLQHLQQLIIDCERRYGRQPGSVQLLAVSKGQSIDNILAAHQAGQKQFGENFVQEALTKIVALQKFDLEWHYIGNIQANKTKKIAEHFAWVHSVSRLKIAERLNEQRPLHLPPLNICIEVNIDQQASKSGFSVEAVDIFAHAIQNLKRLRLRGLMAIPKPETEFEKQRTVFAYLRKIFEKLNQEGLQLDTLSMGMSADFPAAIAEGATIVRVGTKLFGERGRGDI